MKKIMAEIESLEKKIAGETDLKGKWTRGKAIPGTILRGDNESYFAQSESGRCFEGQASDDGFWMLDVFLSKEDYDGQRNSKSLGAGKEGNLAEAKHKVESIAQKEHKPRGMSHDEYPDT